MGMPKIWGEHEDHNREQAITNIIQSVALQEAALASILRAESDKMQAIIGNHHVTTEELFELNGSVKGLIDSVASLEETLKDKLGLFESCLCEREDRRR